MPKKLSKKHRDTHAPQQAKWTAFLIVSLFAALVLGVLIAGRFLSMHGTSLVASAKSFAQIGEANDVMALVEAQEAAVRTIKEKLRTLDTTKFDLEAIRIGKKSYAARGRVITFDASGSAVTHNALVSFYRNAKDEPMQLAMLVVDDEPMFIDQTVLEKIKSDAAP